MSSTEFQPVVIDATGPSIEDDRFVVFTIIEPSQSDGDLPGGPVDYTAPRRISAGTALKALHLAGTRGEAAAEAWCARYALGEAGLNALYGCKHMTPEQAEEILTTLGKLFFGQAREQAGGREPSGN